MSVEVLAQRIQELGKSARAQVGATDVLLLKRLKGLSWVTEILGRVLIHFGPGPLAWFSGIGFLSFHLSVEAQMNHSIMHGAFVGLPGADRYTPTNYESLALPFQSKTWRDAHRIHHANPSLLELDPDTVHPLFRVHQETRWRPWHLFNTFLGALLVFECWAFDYDSYLKKHGVREKGDRGEIRKFLLFFAYQYVLFPALAGKYWKHVLICNLVSVVIRNFVFVGLQTGSSVGNEVSTLHPKSFGRKANGEWYRFQIETSKNFVLRGIWKTICGGLDRHIEHHLYPSLPPNRLHAISGEIKDLCREHGVSYAEYPSVWASLGDSFSYLAKLSKP
jgi:linoleoyl-CoA desaturase